MLVSGLMKPRGVGILFSRSRVSSVRTLREPKEASGFPHVGIPLDRGPYTLNS